jgi:hypothetical protein
MGKDFCINGDLICGKSFSISRYNGYISDALYKYHYCADAIKALSLELAEPRDESNERDIVEAIFAFAYVLREGYEIGNITYD